MPDDCPIEVACWWKEHSKERGSVALPLFSFVFLNLYAAVEVREQLWMSAFTFYLLETITLVSFCLTCKLPGFSGSVFHLPLLYAVMCCHLRSFAGSEDPNPGPRILTRQRLHPLNHFLSSVVFFLENDKLHLKLRLTRKVDFKWALYPCGLEMTPGFRFSGQSCADQSFNFIRKVHSQNITLNPG